MQYIVDDSIYNFNAWSGGKDTLDVIFDKGDEEDVQRIIEEQISMSEEPWTETDINDFLWFERDFIAEQLGYDNWDAYENGDEDEEEEDDETRRDTNGDEIRVGDHVYWDDEAGTAEDGSAIEFIVVDEDENGYFNLSCGEDDPHPSRWAYHSELEIVSAEDYTK